MLKSRADSAMHLLTNEFIYLHWKLFQYPKEQYSLWIHNMSIPAGSKWVESNLGMHEDKISTPPPQ